MLSWIEHALRAERHAVDLALALRHVELLKELAPHLEGCERQHAPSVKRPFDFPGLGISRSTDAGVKDFNQLSTEQPLPALQGLPRPQSPFSVRSFELQDDKEPVIADEESFGPLFPHQQQAQKLMMPTNDEEVATEASPSPKKVSGESAFTKLDLDWQMQQSSTLQTEAFDDTSGIEQKRRSVRRFLRSQRVEGAIGCIIVVNSLCMGLETSYEIAGSDTTAFQILEHIFMAIYVCELSLNFFAHGKSCFKNSWTMFDLVLVSTGVLTSYVIGPIVSSVSTGNSDSMQDSMAGLLVMRMLRLFRLARALRFLVMFKTLWLLVSGLIGSAGTIAYTFILIMLILYIFSCMALELITKRLLNTGPTEVQLLIEERFPNLLVTMLTLLQFVSMDSISSIYFPLIIHDPFLIIFFIPFILIVSICLTNLVTAVIVEGAIEQGNHDKDAQARYKQYKFQKMLPSLKKMFQDLDLDGNGTVTLAELNASPKEMREQLEEVMKADSLAELFDMVDVDESGEVDIDEFCDGVGRIVNSESPVELLRILKHLASLRRCIRDLQVVSDRIQLQVSQR